MAVTVQELFDSIREKEEITLVAGEKGMNSVVRWLHMVESTDISSFLEGEEIAFTTGIGLHNEEELMELVEFNYKQHASAMVINIGPYIKQIPELVIAFGNRVGFPIFSVPWKVHMANIMHSFSLQINLDEQRELEITSALKNAVCFPQNEELYIPALLKYGYKREWSFCIVVVEYLNRKYMPLSEHERSALVRFNRRFFREWKKQMVMLEQEENYVYIFTNISEEKVKESMEAYWREAEPFVCKDGIFYAGIGRTTKSMRCIGKCFNQAERIKLLNKKQSKKNRFVTYNELGIRKLLLEIDNTDVIEEYYNETLGKLEKI